MPAVRPRRLPRAPRPPSRTGPPRRYSSGMVCASHRVPAPLASAPTPPALPSCVLSPPPDGQLRPALRTPLPPPSPSPPLPAAAGPHARRPCRPSPQLPAARVLHPCWRRPLLPPARSLTAMLLPVPLRPRPSRPGLPGRLALLVLLVVLPFPGRSRSLCLGPPCCPVMLAPPLPYPLPLRRLRPRLQPLPPACPRRPLAAALPAAVPAVPPRPCRPPARPLVAAPLPPRPPLPALLPLLRRARFPARPLRPAAPPLLTAAPQMGDRWWVGC